MNWNETNAIEVPEVYTDGKSIVESVKTDNELYNRFLKFQGTIHKHNAYVALEFFAQKPDVDFVGTAAQWEQVGYTVGLGERGIKITDKSGKTYEYFDFSQTLEEKKPMVWTLTKNNVPYLKKELKLPDDKPMIYSLVNRTVKIDDIKQCMKAMGIPNSRATEFINSYANAVQVIISGRLESGGNKFNVKADNRFMKSLSYEQTMYFLMHTLKSARTALDLVEESIKKFNEHERMKRNDIRTVDETENRRETEHTERRTADNTERATGEQADIIENDKNIRQPADVGNITAAAPESENSSVAGIHERDVSGRQNVELPSESYDRNIQSDIRESGTVNGRGTDRIVRNEMDGFHGEGISSSVQYNDAGTQISDRSTQSGQGSTGIQGDSGQSVHGSESETKRIRGNSEVGTGTNDIHRQHSNERDSVSTEEIISDKVNKEASAESADASLYIKETESYYDEDDHADDDLPEIVYASNPSRRLSDNMEAIRRLKDIERLENQGENVIINELDEQILRQYVGWGGLSQVFDENSSIFNHRRQTLKSLLTEEEYKAAEASTLNAHFTPQFVIDAIYRAINNMDLPRNARILEPACGTGNFISRLPVKFNDAEVVGVELDSITARIADMLNRNNDKVTIINSPFEKSGLADNSFDIAIGNVPFGNYNLIDPDHKENWKIHDAFFRKALDKVAPGGVVAFITSTGTLDKKNPKVREYLSQKSDLIGAIRLPDNAFSDAGTKTATDIVFLQKRENARLPGDYPEWCYTAKNEDGLNINSYFVDNPQMILGKMVQTSHFNMLTCSPAPGENLEDQLNKAITYLNAKITVKKREDAVAKSQGLIEPWGNNFTYQINENGVFYRENNVMHELKLKEKDKNQLSALIGLRSATRELVDLQRTSVTDEELIPLRNKLNEMYDKYNAEYGAISSNKQTSKLFGMDYDYPLVLALEEYDKETNTYSKSDIFSKRTVNPYIDIKEAATLEDAFQISMDRKGKIDIPYMAELLKNVYTGENAPSRIADDLIEKGYAFRDPDEIVAGIPFADVREATEYLSGNVRRKLQSAEEHAKGNPEYTRNVDALKKVIPEDIPAEEIAAQMGCTWIDVEDYTKFLEHLSGRDVNHHRNCDVTYDALSGEYSVYKSSARTGFNVNESKTYGTEAMNVYKLAEKILNQRRIVVKTKVPSPSDPSKLVDVTDAKATALVLEKAKLIKSEFKKWLFDDEQRREKYVRRYNNIFNSLVGRKYDGSKLTFPGMNSEFKLRPHQRDCVARTIYGGNTLAAHVVGAGKSAVIVTSVMKKKEIGLINKACVVVPKALTEQTANEWRKIYPDARVLTVTQKDLQEDKRKIFTARVATGSYDAVIMSNEQFEKLAMSKEYQTRYTAKKVDEYEEALRNASGRTSVKKIQESLMKYKIKLENLQNPSSAMKEKDNLIEFESLGFDYLVVDEAHNYKNGDIISKMENVSGVSGKSSARAHDMKMKTDYFNEVFGQGHILFATGTPVSNTMTELYVMKQYLRPDLLKSHGVERFDDWAATFGTVVTKNQQTADGRLKMKTKFASFANLPELMAMYKEFADIQSAEKLNLPRPALKTGKIQIVQVKATPEQKAYVKLLAKRAEAVEAGKVKPYEDNHLAITGEARLVGLGNLAIKSLYERRGEELPADFVIEKNSKVDVCISKVAELYKQTEETKGVQIIFSDIAINSDNGNFSAYDYIRNELINEHGIPAEEIVYAPKADAKNREQIFSDINNSKYRVVIASTATLGTGANIQKNLYALHHIDIPWKPSDFTQREGRILRQGNQNKEVEIFNYVTESTLDSYLYQTVTDKARFIAQLLDNNAPARVSEDCDEKVLSFAELQAAAEGNPEFKRRIELSNEISELTMLKSEYDYETAVTRRSLEKYPGRIEMYKDNIAKCSIDVICASAVRENSLQITTHTGAVLTESKDINDYLIKVARNSAFSPNPSSIHFKIGDFDVRAKTALYIGGINGAEFEVTGKLSYTCEAGTEDNSNNCARINNLFDKIIPKHMETLKAELECTESNMAQAKIRVETPFSDEEKLEKLTEEFNALEEKLSGLSDIKDDVIDAEEAAVTDSSDANNNTNYDSPDSSKIDDDDGIGGPSI